MNPLVGLWLNLGAVLIQLSGPGPLGEQVGWRKPGEVRQIVSVVVSVLVINGVLLSVGCFHGTIEIVVLLVSRNVSLAA